MAATFITLFQSSSGQKAGCNLFGSLLAWICSRFQSSSGQKAGCNLFGSLLAWICSRFQSSSGQKAGCNVTSWVSPPSVSVFQSSSGLLAGCNRRSSSSPGHQAPPPVSILIRPEGRMQLSGTSSPKCLVCRFRFNPHPAFWPDATLGTSPTCQRRLKVIVSILIRPSGWMQQWTWYHGQPTWSSKHVSILIRPSGRMQPRMPPVTAYRLVVKRIPVSILIRPSGRMQPCNPYRIVEVRPSSNGFNPHPAFWPDATAGRCSSPAGSSQGVSILIRPEGRMQLPSSTG